ncbi:MAG: asparagine synthase (glutamine-hydrolyzing) [Pirellulales bacterium]|nr:asparagine synthase (glutamine-hydrolyzing) [Pirellulales bacterium]
MCGITGGIWTEPGLSVEAATLERMVDVLAHRGPDDSGTYVSEYRVRPGRETMPGVALGHRRLSIIGLATGHQPMANEDESVWVVFNGEIYNFGRLRRRLEGSGHRFRTESDTEVLVHLYEDEGRDMLGHLEGMFSFAVWDARRCQLLLARDRLGQKPLVYRHEPGRLLFASELKSLLEVPGVPRRIDPQALDEYLAYQYVPHPRTILEGIHKLPPAHWALWRDGRLETGCYWRPDFNRVDRRPRQEMADELRKTLTDAVQKRLQSEVPLGAFLSGGVDSTIVVGLMKDLTDEPVRTFSIGFPVAEYDETRYARLAAEQFGTVHEEFRVEPDAVDVLDKLVWHFDEPFADSSAVPTWYVAQLTRQHVTVALTGDGGDELFAGYPRYRAVALASRFDRLPAGLRSVLAGRYWQLLPSSPRQKSIIRRGKRFVEVLRQTPWRRYFDWISIFNEAQRAALYTDEMVGSLPDADPIQFLLLAAARSAGRDPVTQTSLTDLLTYLPCDLMTKVDIASMAHGLECRQPFLDHRVVELAARMPVVYKYRRNRGKRILLETFADLIPRPIRRRRKMGFGVPLDAWFRGPLSGMARAVLLDTRTTARGYFRPETVTALLDDHQSGRFDHSYRLWSLLVLELWQRRWLD